MDMALYERILGELDAPEVIRLNYSGESTNHPQIAEAVRIASATGATTELVTALASLPDRLVEPLVRSGLDRLTLSLHTLDEGQFHAIYGYGSVASVRRKLAAIVAARNRVDSPRPAVDLAFVAMRRNLGQLLPIASFASRNGLAGLAIHPVIRRDPTPDAFTHELDGDRLRPEFLAELASHIDEVRRQHPDVPLSVSTPEIDGAACLGSRPVAYPGPLPDGARIHSCAQNPWETVHILADGTVVTCEVRDRIAVGRVEADASGPGLAAIWHGPSYAQFRDRYRAGAVPECRVCPYKAAYLPGPATCAIAGCGGPSRQLLHGWHDADGSGLLWAKRTAALELARPSGARWLRLEGWIPQRVDRVDVRIDGVDAGELAGAPATGAAVQRRFALPAIDRAMVRVELHVNRPLVPLREGLGADCRELGFGLKHAAII
jgi:MoaA/NifB/PqqE/SkfB family radical SAM enzyme